MMSKEKFCRRRHVRSIQQQNGLFVVHAIGHNCTTRSSGCLEKRGQSFTPLKKTINVGHPIGNTPTWEHPSKELPKANCYEEAPSIRTVSGRSRSNLVAREPDGLIFFCHILVKLYSQPRDLTILTQSKLGPGHRLVLSAPARALGKAHREERLRLDMRSTAVKPSDRSWATMKRLPPLI